jgi:hypothetical protein
MEHEDDQQEGMSTGKKVVAGAAIGVAVPTAVGVAKKLLGNGDGNKRGAGAQAADRGRQAAGRAKDAASSTARKASRTAKGTARKTAGSAKSTGSKARSSGRRAGSSGTRRAGSTARRASSSASRGTNRTKEQLYNQAKRLNIEGRSSMTKAQLERAIARKRS